MKHYLLIWFSSLLSLTLVQAQTLQVSLPIEGAIYQQNASGQGKIVVRGDLNSKSFLLGGIYAIKGSLQKLQLANGAPRPEPRIDFQLSQQRTTFSGEQTVAKGWYELTIRAEVISAFPFYRRTYEIKRKVGIGEVFIIAGQSNAQGGFGYIAPNTQLMDAVRVSPDLIPDFQRSDPSNLPPSYRTIQGLVSTTTNPPIGPLGPDLWYWGSVGAKIALDCDAPVAMFNAAYGGTTITNWITSTNQNAKTSGQTDATDPTAGRYQPGSPFYFFANMFRLYASTYGVRAVLWMQGETDTKAIAQANSGPYQNTWTDRILFDRNNQPVQAPLGNGNLEKRWVRNDEEYRQKLRALIEASRGQLNNRPVPWVIAQTSFITNQTSPVVIAGQDVSRLGLSEVYQGPSTDDLGSTYRRPGGSGADEPVHFNQNGLDIVANRWTDVLKSVCRYTTPISVQDLGTEPREVEISQDGRTASAPAGFTGYSWSYDNGSANADLPVSTGMFISTGGGVTSGQQTSSGQGVSNGTYRAFLQNAQGNFVLTQNVNLPYTIVDDTGGDTPPPPTGGGDCQAFNETCSGNDQEIRYVTLNVATAGNYPLTITYKSGEKPVDALVRVGNATTSVHYNQTTTYTTATSGSVFLNQGANTIGLSSGTGGGYVCFTNICTGTSGGNPPTPNCDFNISVNSANASCNQQGVQLTASCNGANCDGLSYSWDGGQSGQTASFNAGGSNGSTNYSVTVARSGCSNKTATGTINVSGCGGGNPPVGACQSFGAVCSGNGQEVQYVSLNVATAGSYPLTITYTSHEKAVDAIVRVGSTTTPIHYNQTTYGAYTTATTGSVYLTQGANSIGLSSGSEGGYVCFNNICAGSGSGRVGASDAGMESDGLTLQLYPNPNAGQFQARMVTVQGRRYSLEVTNLLGKSLHKREFVGKGGVQTETIELANTPTGIVLVLVQSGGKRVSKTLLIQR